MNKHLPLFNRVLAVLTLVGLVMISYFLWARPYQLRWGATEAELLQGMPGDELNPEPTFLAKGYERDPAKLEANLRHVYRWRDEVIELEKLL
jgi:hypothetical protein